MLELSFYFLLLLCLYPYLLYPVVVFAWAKIVGESSSQPGGCQPHISVVISVYNEERVIREKIDNTLQLLYPEHLLEILVVSDGSTDRTNEIVGALGTSRVTLKAFPGRKGKTACLNRTVPEALGDIIVFTDANSMFPLDLLQQLSANFANDSIGLVTGWTKYRKPGRTEETVGLYSRLEMFTKEAESRISSCVGADGAVFAIRKTLFQPLKESDINDFVIPLQVIAQGKRVVLDPAVYCIEQPGDNEAREYRRQVRITTRTLGAIGRNRQFLNPLRYGSFSFFLFSHKVIRFLVPFSFAGLLITAVLLTNSSLLYAGFATAQLIFIGIGLAGLSKHFTGRLPQLCSFFLLTIAAQLVGWARWTLGKTDVIWKPAR